MSTLTRLLLAAGLCLAIPRAALAEDADAFYKQGIAYKQEGKSEQAIAAFEHAVAANPKHYMAWASLGNLYKTARKDIPKAVSAYEHAVEGLKKDKVVWANLGMAYYRNNQIDSALKALVTANTLDPNDAEIRFNLGTVRRQKGDLPGAIADLEVAVKLKPDDAQYVNNLGVAYRYAKREDDAIKAFQQAIEEIRPKFHQCTRCGHWVCPEVCWNEQRQLCENCAPNLAEEAAAQQAQIAAQQIGDKMRQVDQVAGFDPLAEMVSSCPHCRARLAAGAKFCAGCGKPVGSGAAKAFCTGCGTQLPPGAKFCSGCGQAAG